MKQTIIMLSHCPVKRPVNIDCELLIEEQCRSDPYTYEVNTSICQY